MFHNKFYKVNLHKKLQSNFFLQKSQRRLVIITYYFWSVCGFNVITIAPTIANNNIIDVMINHIE